MTIIAVFVVLVAGYAIYTLILIGMKNENTRSNKEKYQLLSKLGSRLNLSFSSHLVAGNKFIALDGIKKILLVSEGNHPSIQPYIIDLTKVMAVSVRKSYGNIQPGELKKQEIEKFLKTIDLQFEYPGKDQPVILPFYNAENDDFLDLARIDRNAKNWQMILTKMITPQAEKKFKPETSCR